MGGRKTLLGAYHIRYPVLQRPFQLYSLSNSDWSSTIYEPFRLNMEIVILDYPPTLFDRKNKDVSNQTDETSKQQYLQLLTTYIMLEMDKS